MGALPQLIDSHLAEQGMTRKRFAELCHGGGWTDTKTEAFGLFDASSETFFYQIVAAQHILGLNESAYQALEDAAFADTGQRMAENRRNRARAKS